jgi:ketosteroid isomerase-like protein
MSQENVETIRRCEAAMSRGDVDSYLLDIHADVELIPRRAAVQGTYHGHAGVRMFITENAESFDLFEVSTTEFRELGHRVLAFGTVRVRGRESGVEVTHPTALLVTFQHGKIIRLEDFGERDAALEAVGLSEQDAHADS